MKLRACRIRPTAALAAATVAACLTPLRGEAANWFVETGVRSELTFTDNARFDERAARADDVILSLSPTLVVRGEGRRLRVSGSASLTGLTYLNGSQSSAFTPVGSFGANLEAVERWLFIDAGLSATRSLDNPLGPRPDGPSSVNRATTSTARISPYIERELPNELRLVVRSDNAWTRTDGDAGVRSETVYASRHSLRLAREPQPFGIALEARRTDERVDSGVDRAPAIDVARLRLSYALTDQFAFGVRGGYERSEAFVDGDARSFGGVEILWRATDRTRLEAYWEDRSFGDSYDASFTHRSPRLVWDFRVSRDLTTFGDAFIEIPATGDLAALLDAALRTRVTDPIERARAVEEFIGRRGLPRSLPGPITVFSDQLFVQTGRRGTLTFIGNRGTLALTGFYQRDASPSGSSFSLLSGPLRDTLQQGGSVTYSHRISSVSSALASAGWTRTRDSFGTTGIVPVAAGESTQWTYRLQADVRLAPRTSALVGTRFQKYESTTLSSDTYERAVFTGLAHRF